MARLVEPKVPAAGQRHMREQAPALVLYRRAGRTVLRQLLNHGLDIGTHQIELMDVVAVRRMNGDFRWGKAENKPPMPGVDAGELEEIAQKGTVWLRILAVDNRMRAGNHWDMPFPTTYSHKRTPRVRAGAANPGFAPWDMIPNRRVPKTVKHRSARERKTDTVSSTGINCQLRGTEMRSSLALIAMLAFGNVADASMDCEGLAHF